MLELVVLLFVGAVVLDCIRLRRKIKRLNDKQLYDKINTSEGSE